VSNWFRKNPFLVLSILITPVLLWIGFVSGGGGHGNYVAARVIFPFACVFTGTYVGAGVVGSVLAVLQWPVYGFLIDWSSHKVRTVGAVLIVHAAICLWLFTKGSESFR
jgi:hypothetical protein